MSEKVIERANKNFRTRKKETNNRQIAKRAHEVIVIERRYNVIELRRDGWTVRQIADYLGVGYSTVSDDIQMVLNEALENMTLTVEQERQLQVERMEQLIKTYTKYATQPTERVVIDPATRKERVILMPPDPQYATLILKIEERKAKLLGLDAPEVKHVEHTGIREYRGVDVSKV